MTDVYDDAPPWLRDGAEIWYRTAGGLVFAGVVDGPPVRGPSGKLRAALKKLSTGYRQWMRGADTVEAAPVSALSPRSSGPAASDLAELVDIMSVGRPRALRSVSKRGHR